MRYNRLGQSGLVVSELCLGAMTFGNKPSGFFQHELDQEGSTALVRQALDAGVNFIDTANLYTAGQSEEFVGGALRTLGVARDQIVIATKGMGPMGEGPNDAGANRYHLLHQIDASLARLGLDHVDLYQVHGWDPSCGMEETLRALEDIVRSGRARYVGVSNWAAWQIAKALGICDRRGWDQFIAVQALYTAANRELERELVPNARSFISTTAARRPRRDASRAMPAPLMPPPITRRSYVALESCSRVSARLGFGPWAGRVPRAGTVCRVDRLVIAVSTPRSRASPWSVRRP